MQEHLYSDANYIEFENIDTMFLKDDVTPSIIENTSLIKTSLTEAVKYSPINNELIANNIVINQQYTNILISNVTDGGGSSNSGQIITPEVQNYPLPIYNEEGMTSNFEVNNTLNGMPFIGIVLPRDTCIKFYNQVAGFLNTQVMNAANGSSGFYSSLIHTILSFSLSTTLAVVIEQLLFYFKDIFSTFISLFQSGPLGVFLGVVIAIFTIGTILVLIAMFYLGYRREGYAIGFLVRGAFNLEWYNDKIY